MVTCLLLVSAIFPICLFAYEPTIPVVVLDGVYNFQSPGKQGIIRVASLNKGVFEESAFWVGEPGQVLELPEMKDDVPALDYKTFAEWNAPQGGEFNIIYKEPSNQRLKILKNMFCNYGLTSYAYVPEVKEMLFKNPIPDSSINNHVKAIKITEDGIVLLSRKLGRSVLAKFQGKIEYHTVGFDYVDGKLVACTIEYRRLFHHGIILDRTSFVELKMAADGTPLRVKIRWPDFQFIGKNDATPFSDILNGIPQGFSAHTWAIKNGGDTVKFARAVVDGVSMSWRAMDAPQGSILTPCYRFKASMYTQDGKVTDFSIDVPRLMKYY